MNRGDEKNIPKVLGDTHKQAIVEAVGMQRRAGSGWCHRQPRAIDIPALPKFVNMQQRHLFMEEFFTQAINRLQKIDGVLVKQISKAQDQQNHFGRTAWCLLCVAMLGFPSGTYTTYRFRDVFFTTYNVTNHHYDTNNDDQETQDLHGEGFIYAGLAVAFLLLFCACVRCCVRQDEYNISHPLQLDTAIQVDGADAKFLTDLTTLCTAINREEPAVELLDEKEREQEERPALEGIDIPLGVDDEVSTTAGGERKQQAGDVVALEIVNLEVKQYEKPRALVNQCRVYVEVLRDYKKLGPRRDKVDKELQRLMPQQPRERGVGARPGAGPREPLLGGFVREGSMQRDAPPPITYGGYDQHGPKKKVLREQIAQIDQQVGKTEKLIDCGYGQILKNFLPTLGTAVVVPAEDDVGVRRINMRNGGGPDVLD